MRRLDISYVGSRGKNLESSEAFNYIPLNLRQQCDAWEGGSAAYCQALVPNPFYQLAPFNGTSYYSSPTLARSTLGGALSAIRWHHPRGHERQRLVVQLDADSAMKSVRRTG